MAANERQKVLRVEDNIPRNEALLPNTIEIDGDTVRSFDYNTLVAAGNSIDIDNNMTEQMLSIKDNICGGQRGKMRAKIFWAMLKSIQP